MEREIDLALRCAPKAVAEIKRLIRYVDRHDHDDNSSIRSTGLLTCGTGTMRPRVCKAKKAPTLGLAQRALTADLNGKFWACVVALSQRPTGRRRISARCSI